MAGGEPRAGFWGWGSETTWPGPSEVCGLAQTGCLVLQAVGQLVPCVLRTESLGSLLLGHSSAVKAFLGRLSPRDPNLGSFLLEDLRWTQVGRVLLSALGAIKSE